MKIFVATYSDSSGFGYQKVFKHKSLASDWLKKSFARDNGCNLNDPTFLTDFKDHCEYGTWWNGKIKSFEI